MINFRHAGRNSKRSLSFDFCIIYSISLLKHVTLLGKINDPILTYV